MRSLIIIIACSSLIACGGGGKSDLVEACMANGDSKEKCTCAVDELESDLSTEAFNVLVLEAQGQEDKAMSARKDLGTIEMVKMAGIRIGVIAKCGVTSFTQ